MSLITNTEINATTLIDNREVFYRIIMIQVRCQQYREKINKNGNQIIIIIDYNVKMNAVDNLFSGLCYYHRTENIQGAMY